MKKTAVLIAGLAMALSANAQGLGLWLNAGAEKQITKGFDAGFDAEYRQRDNFKTTDRWSAGVSMSKRLFRNEAKTFVIKASAGYKLIQVFEPYETKYKENGKDFNVTDPYKVLRHRATASVQASLELGRFKLSLKEGYQYTTAQAVTVTRTKYRWDQFERQSSTQDNVSKGDMSKSVLRSRFAVDYNIPHWKYDPFVSYELFSNLNDGFATDKTRLSAGIDFTLKKKHDIEIAYIYQSKSDEDEQGGSAISIGYTFNF